jgi:hypothetical protein
MPSKAQIKKVLTGGTPHQRASLLANHAGAWAIQSEGFLTDEEKDALDASFKTDFELKTYRKFAKLDELFRECITQLSQFSLEHELIQTKIQLFNHTRSMLESLENLFGALAYEVRDRCGEEAQIAIWETVLERNRSSFPMGSKPEIEIEETNEENAANDPEMWGTKRAYFRFKGYKLPEEAGDFISIRDFDRAQKKGPREAGEAFSYSTLLKASGDKLTKLRSLIKTWIATLRSIMSEHSFHVQPYKKFIDGIEKRVQTDQAFTLPEGTLEKVREFAEAKEGEDQNFFREQLEKEEKTKRLFLMPYEEITLDRKQELFLRELFIAKEILNGPR